MVKARFNKWRPIRDTDISVVQRFVTINTARQPATVQPMFIVLVDYNVSLNSANWIGTFYFDQFL